MKLGNNSHMSEGSSSSWSSSINPTPKNKTWSFIWLMVTNKTGYIRVGSQSTHEGSVRASPPVLSMSLWIIKLNVLSLPFFFGNPTNTTVTGTTCTWGLLIANHMDESLWWTNEKYWAAVKSTLLHSILDNCVAPFTSHGKLHEFVQKYQFPELNRHILTFSQ
jgi:hypothetical protein